MNSFETSQTDSSLSLENEPEPLPITAELVGELIHYIHDLWSQHHSSKRGDQQELKTKLHDELRRAYDELEALRSDLANLQLSEDLWEEIEYELWFACHHLHKVLKY